MENKKDDEAKKRLMLLCSKINKLPKGSHEILQKVPICNLRQIERQAKNVKDPSPLQTMMASISEKYPISVDSEKAKAIGMPISLLGPTDTHRFGRQLAKKEAINWFITHSANPTEGVKRAIDICYKNHRKMASDFYNWDWSCARISMGLQQLRREVVRTNTVLVDAPKGSRNDLIIAAMFPDNIIRWANIDMQLLEELKTVLGDISEAKLPLLHQMRLLSSMMDPKERMLPITSSVHPSCQYFRHSFSSYYHIVKVVQKNPHASERTGELGDTIGRAIAWRASQGVSIIKLRDSLNKATIVGNTPRTIALMTKEPGVFRDLFRTVMGVASPVVIEVKGTKMYPQGGKIRSVRLQNRIGTHFYAYEGREEVIFSYSSTPVMFVHNGSLLGSLKILKGNGRILGQIVARIALMLKIGWLSSRKRSIRMMQMECFDNATKEPWIALSTMVGYTVSKSEYRRKSLNSENFACVEFINEFPNIGPRAVDCIIEWPHLIYGNGMTITVARPLQYPSLPAAVDFKDMVFSDHFAPADRLKHKIGFFLVPGNYTRMMERAYERDFEWENEGIREGVQGANKDKIHGTARSLFQRMMCDDNTLDTRILIILYLFASNANVVVSADQHMPTFQWYGSISIDLRATSGILTINDHGILVNGVLMKSETTRLKPETLLQFVPGWQIVSEPKHRVPTVPFRVLQDRTFSEGRVVSVGVFGRLIYLQRSAASVENYLATINRQIHAFEAADARAAKRRRDEEDDLYYVEDSDNQPGPSRRVRLDEDADIMAQMFDL